MAANRIINVNLFGREIGRIGLQEDERRSSFQYSPEYLEGNTLRNIFPSTGIIKPTKYVQMFSQFDSQTFKGIPPQFADSLPDLFGSIIFRAWLETKEQSKINVLQQLAYVGNRGMGALEYRPSISLTEDVTLDLDEIIEVLREVMNFKQSASEQSLDHQALINIFKIGSSAGGARPKILISEHKQTGRVIPGDVEYSDAYHHYLVKLAIEDEDYPREIIEYCYAQTLIELGVRMMESKLVEDKHFATMRYDRQGGEKQHVLTATGMTGWDYKNPTNSSYDNLFKLCSFLKIPHAQVEELYKRMVFNVCYGNIDDHLKNHSFIYNREDERWELSPAYDVTFALNPLINFKEPRRALSINGKRSQITLDDALKIADDFTIKNPLGIVKQVQACSEQLVRRLKDHAVPRAVIERMQDYFVRLI